MSSCGRYGEFLFQQRMASAQYQVKDVSDNPDYWYKDIDFIITSPTTGAVKSFEVKWDSRLNATGNMYLELTNVHSKGGRGWWDFCQADYLAYGDAKANVFYVFTLSELRERVGKLATRAARCGSDSTGLLVSLKDVEDLARVV